MSNRLQASLEVLDGTAQRAALAASRWRDDLAASSVAEGAESPALEDRPLARHRETLGQTMFDALSARAVFPHETALRDAIRSWVGALTVARITEPHRVDEARAEAGVSLDVRLDVLSKTSFRGAWRGLLGASSVAVGQAWLAAAAEGGPSVANARHERAVVEEEVARRLGYASVVELLGGPSESVLAPLARAFLVKTADLARSLRAEKLRRGDLGSAVREILDARGRDAADGWPRTLSLRALVETLGAPKDLGRGLRVGAAMPKIVGAASFARGLERFGEGYRRAAALSTSQPFSTMHPPWFVDAPRFGFALASLAQNIQYQQKGLGLGSRVAEQQARTLRTLALLEARVTAMAYLLAPSERRPDRSLFEELTTEVYGDPLPSSLAGAFPRVDRAAERVTALLTTLPLLTTLRDQFDEDWFRNPRAWVFLRVRGSAPVASAAPGVPEETPDPVALARAFEEGLG